MVAALSLWAASLAALATRSTGIKQTSRQSSTWPTGNSHKTQQTLILPPWLLGLALQKGACRDAKEHEMKPRRLCGWSGDAT